jgi:AraC family transcriptional regulator, transcriptional activator of pobA
MKNIPIRCIQATPNEPTISEGFSIRDLGVLLDGQDMVQGLHRHDFFYILALKKGMGHHEIDFTAYEVSDRSVFFMRPGQVHQHTLKAGSTGYLMGFTTDFYYSQNKVPNYSNGYQLLRKASNASHYHLDANRFEKLLSLLACVFQEYTDKQERYLEVIKANLEILFIELIRQNSQIPPTHASPYTQERLEKFLELLEKHITSHKQVAQYADMLNLSPYQLNAITKAMLGKTGSDLINEYIILESKRHLLATSNQVIQIAYHLGYEDVSYFIRFFKKHTGHSPEAFRYNFR